MVSKTSDFQNDLNATLILDFYELANYNIKKVDNSEYTEKELNDLINKYISDTTCLLKALLDKNSNYNVVNELVKVDKLDKSEIENKYIQEIVQVVLFRLCYLESKQLIKEKDRRKLIETYLYYLKLLITQSFEYYDKWNKYCVNDQLSIHILGSYILNYSRSLTDINAKYSTDFEKDFKLCIEKINKSFTFAVKHIDQISELKDPDLCFIKDALMLLTDVIKNGYLKDRVDSFCEDVNLPKDINTLKLFEDLKITVVEEDIGVLGLVDGKDGIVLSVYHLRLCPENQKKTRFIIQILHEFGHYLIRANSEFLVANTPRRNNNNKRCQKYEAGYLLEYYVFSLELDTIKKQYWVVAAVQNFILNLSNWNSTMKDFSQKIHLLLSSCTETVNMRGSNFNDSGMEIDLEKSVKE